MMKQNDVTETIQKWLESVHWHYRFDATHQYFDMNMLSKSQLPFMRLIIDAHIQDFVIFYVILPFKCDKVRHSALMEFLTRINYGLINGNFEMDVCGGGIRYKICITYAGLESLPTEIISDSINRACFMMDKHAQRLREICEG